MQNIGFSSNLFQNISPFKKGSHTVPLNSKFAHINGGSHLILGNDYVLNTNSSKIMQLFDEKDTIVIGTSDKANVVVPSFYDGVKNIHMSLHKSDDGIYAQGATPDSKFLEVKKSDIKPFYFGTNDIKLSQSNVGDCFLLATLYSMSLTKFGQKAIKNMVKIDSEGNYVVSFFDKKKILVSPEELDGQGDKKSVFSELGIKAIERAYAKLLNPSDDSSRNYINLNRGGFMDDALRTLTGLKTDKFDIQKSDLDVLLTDISEYGLENQILTCSTPCTPAYGRYMDVGEKFISAHAYSIKSIDAMNRKIEVVNPHNTKKSELISFDEFKEIFQYVCVARLQKDTN